jgi:hypothetical protein
MNTYSVTIITIQGLRYRNAGQLKSESFESALEYFTKSWDKSWIDKVIITEYKGHMQKPARRTFKF